MTRPTRRLSFAWLCAALCACNPKPSAESAASHDDASADDPSADEAPAPSPEPSEQAADASGEPTEAPTQSGSPPAAPKEPLSKLCGKMCDAVAPKCTPLQVKGCKSTCDNYDQHPEACDGVVRAALTCAQQEKDFLFCANVVPDSCARQFKAIEICNTTGKPPEDPAAAGLPSGWERFKGDGFSVAVPKGMKRDTSSQVPKWSVTAPSGARYEVEIFPSPPASKPLNKTYLKASRELFGRCSDKMKLHALIEKDDRSSMQYKMTCPPEAERVGTLHMVGERLYVMSVHFPKGQTVELDAFVYSFGAP